MFFPFLINVSGKQYIPPKTGCYLKRNRPRNIPCKKSLQNHGNNDNIEYLFPEHVHKNMIINENLLNVFSSIIHLLSGF